jgi:pantothenate kinase-related protein Tda10
MTVAQHIRYKAERIAAFIAAQRKALKEDRPLLVSMQGPQGCGECECRQLESGAGE